MSETPSAPPPRRPGGQPTNCNACSLGAAFKHGFYSRTLRLSIRSTVESYQSGNSGLDLLSFGRYLCLALTDLDRLIRTHHFLATQKDDFSDALQKAMDDWVTEGFIKTETE